MAYDLFDVMHTRRIIGSNLMVFPDGFVHPDRILPYHDIFCVISGEIEMAQDDERFLGQSGDIFVLTAGRHHYGVSRSSKDLQTCYIHILTEDLDGKTDLYPQTMVPVFQEHANLFTQPTEDACTQKSVLLPTKVSTGTNGDLIQLIKQISTDYISMSLNQKFYSNLSTTSLLYQMFCTVANETMEENELINTILEIMSQEQDYALTIDEVAKRLFISPSTLARRFNHATGVTFHKYFINLRLERSCELLRNFPSATLHDVAAQLGFYDEFHFSKAFTRKYTYSPSEYRRRSVK